MNKPYKKSLALLVSLLVLVCVAVGGTLAYLIDQTQSIPNTFIPSEVTVEVNETFDGAVKSDVSIKNTGDTTAYIRAAVIITWQDAQGNVYGQMPVEDTDYTIEWGTGWLEDANGFYYWTQPVAADKNTGILIEEATVVEGAAPSDYYLCIEIIASGIQSEPKTVVEGAWGVTVTDGAIDSAATNG